MKSLLLTLGHNSSAVFVDGKTVVGYEQERISGIKADSQFPADAINEIVKHVGFNHVKGSKIFISHWFDMNDTTKLQANKYITEMDIENLKAISEDITIVDNKLTHHDAHAYSGLAFFNYHNNNRLPKGEDLHILVADGFGINQEVLSFYRVADYYNNPTPELVKRVYGYNRSLGLMYQYATSYTGMKENQDEYKFLGYESHIDEYLNEGDITVFSYFVNNNIDYLTESLSVETKPIVNDIEFDINYAALGDTKKFWYAKFDEVVEGVLSKKENLGKEENEFRLRCVIAYFIQQSIEKYFDVVIKQLNIKNVIVVGGTFYNVKLNNYIFENTNGLYCAMPLAGDQGAAVGMYLKYTGEQFPFDTLCISRRTLYNAKKLCGKNPRVKYFEKMNDVVINEIAHKISDGELVNLVYGAMEFGPRALCHTSSLFLPATENTAANNTMNNRNEVMPCAPVCTEENARVLFGDDIDRVIGSDSFMILTHNYKRDYCLQYGGVMHKKTLENVYTGRPQIADKGSYMEKILMKVQEICDARCLVNTSFNAHGRPIVFEIMDVLHNFNYQVEHAEREDKKPYLYIVSE